MYFPNFLIVVDCHLTHSFSYPPPNSSASSVSPPECHLLSPITSLTYTASIPDRIGQFTHRHLSNQILSGIHHGKTWWTITSNQSPNTSSAGHNILRSMPDNITTIYIPLDFIFREGLGWLTYWTQIQAHTTYAPVLILKIQSSIPICSATNIDFLSIKTLNWIPLIPKTHT